MKNQNTKICLILFFCLFVPNIAHAADPLESALSIVKSTYTTGRSIAYYVAAIGIIIMAICSFFGRFQFKTFFSICAGVFLIGSMDSFIVFLGGKSLGLSSSSSSSSSSGNIASVLNASEQSATQDLGGE